MLVEDDNNLREIYEARLLAEGYEIISAKDGEEALSLAMKEKPDLIISDVMMPKISGFDMLDLLRSTPETRDTKVIMMTALSQAEDKNRADKLGADRYLVKSQVTLEDVAKVAKEVLDGQSDQSATTAGTAVIDPTAPVADTSVATPTDTAPVDTSTPPATDVSPAAAPVADPSNQTAPADAPAASPAAPTNSDDSATANPAAPATDTVTTDSAAPAEPTEPTTPAPAPDAGDAPVAEAAPTPATPAEPAPVSNEPAPTLPTTDVDQNLAAPAEAENEQIKSQIDQFVSTVPSNEPPAPEVPAAESSAPAPDAEAAADTLEPQTNSESPATGLTTLEPTTTIPVKEAPPVVEAPDNASGNGSTQKKIIQPINDLSKTETNLNELLEKEQQKEAAAAGAAPAAPPATSVVEPGGATVTPPIADQAADPSAPGATVAPAPAPSADDPANVAL